MKTRLRAIEHRAVSGIWLLGEGFEDIIISEETYGWLWRNIYIICDNPRLIKMFWANSNQYFDRRLKAINPDYTLIQENLVVTNKEHIQNRNKERSRFLEFHYALGGLLLFRKQYKTLSYLFEYSQAQPPKYVLFPQTMGQIFDWFENFRNEFRHKVPIDSRYEYPELDNLGNSRQVIYWICSYIAVLFLRQYSLMRYKNGNLIADLQLPEHISELKSWLDSIPFFEKCLTNVIANKDLIKDLKFENLVEKKDDLYSLIIQLKESIKDKIGSQKLNMELSENKIDNFCSKSNKIISQAFDAYKTIFITKDETHSRSELKLVVNGEMTLMSKSAFIDNDIPYLNYDTVFAEMVANRVKRLIPHTFLIARTKRYLLSKDDIILALSKIIDNNDDIAIIGVNIGNEVKKILGNSQFQNGIQHIPSTEYNFQDTLFILRQADLPAIEHKDIVVDEKEELQLRCINKDLKLYASVIDINKLENRKIKDKWDLKEEGDNGDLKVQLAISFLSIIYWKDYRQVIQINIASKYREQGILNDLNEITALSPIEINKGTLRKND